MPISSHSNPHIKQIRSLNQRKARRETGLYFIEGIRIVGEAVQLGASVETIVVAPALLTSAFGWELVETCRASDIPCLEVTGDVFRRLSHKDGPQGLGAVARQQWEALDHVYPGDELGWVVLDEIQNPGNLGAILRTCDAVGCAGVMLLGDAADPYDPAAVRGSMGALFSQRLVRTNADALAAWKHDRHVVMIGASDAATTDYQARSYHPPVLLCMGNEQHGLSAEHQAFCDAVVRIPMTGRSDSLNLAVATGVVLYEVFNQNR